MGFSQSLLKVPAAGDLLRISLKRETCDIMPFLTISQHFYGFKNL
jgi:hypothetical protein